MPNIDFVDLQYSDCAEERLDVQRDTGIVLHRWPAALDNYDETAALVSALDLVISVQTAVVHLAGALGRSVWVLIPAVPEWRYGETGTSMLWYPSARLFRQREARRWGPLIDEVTDELALFATRSTDVQTGLPIR